eukprot:CAMPEP_0170184934 /NCGR_PEP_ID=MMETSP0040_2-20121228/35119_1 /TAXON_ID=641309 /ORGANISM="Lotharella oceanica, Strain CCMP622" /LENGTH=108 /DNA_ID=CAMNT_0010431153 /DNA_START=115 /DNA_END=441 /DNA_ORIENTATION=-
MPFAPLLLPSPHDQVHPTACLQWIRPVVLAPKVEDAMPDLVRVHPFRPGLRQPLRTVFALLEMVGTQRRHLLVGGLGVGVPLPVEVQLAARPAAPPEPRARAQAVVDG